MAAKITRTGTTKDKISGRGDLTLFLLCLENIGLYQLISNNVLSLLALANKGLSPYQFLKQMFAFFIDGADMSIAGFDRKKKDVDYAAVSENDIDQMASSTK